MRKRLVALVQQDSQPINLNWLSLQEAAEVEISSEQADYPVEAALFPDNDRGWRAAVPGKQQIRLIFTEPQDISRIQVCFIEAAVERTQEFLLSWSAEDGQSLKTLIRQQWNFSPAGSTQEMEDLHVNLSGVKILELVIIPDIKGGQLLASLASLRIA